MFVFPCYCAEKGDIFGWGNSEYNQLAVVTEETQVCDIFLTPSLRDENLTIHTFSVKGLFVLSNTLPSLKPNVAMNIQILLVFCLFV